MNVKTARQIFDFLPGRWQITRNVRSLILPENIKAEGAGSFIISPADPDLILYEEEVIIHDSGSGASRTGRQKYQYRYDRATSSIAKYFSDGSFFYKLDISGDKISGNHLCIRDTYAATYVFEEKSFTLAYRVNGPSKNYEIISEYSKMTI